ncbi:Pol protein [Phytophthora palmivora]|uniref:Pol protein n=1 Tax=Phytophthora palmivora TaxID=4796 RepID=A0A2P4XXH1_9STRA|nr:Pol protein [Phytophthora palmivora]
MALAQDKQKEYSDKQRGNLPVFKEESNKLKHRFIGPFAVLARHGAAYTIDLPKSMATHPTFYVGVLSGITIRWALLLGRRKTKVRTHLLETRLSPLDNRSCRCRSL